MNRIGDNSFVGVIGLVLILCVMVIVSLVAWPFGLNSK